MTEQELYEMPLHSWKRDSASQIQRVIGGWVYHYDSSAFGSQTSTFVPEPPQSIENILGEIIGESNSGRLFINIRNQ